VSSARRQALLILLGVAVLTLSIIVYVRNRSPDDDILATIGVLGAIAIIVVSLPGPNGRNGH
jgi:hypothetical protein